MVVRDRIPSDPAIFKHDVPNEVRRWSLPELDTPAGSLRTCVKQVILAQWEPWDHHLIQPTDQTPADKHCLAWDPEIHHTQQLPPEATSRSTTSAEEEAVATKTGAAAPETKCSR
jgi:hypothetical protein